MERKLGCAEKKTEMMKSFTRTFILLFSFIFLHSGHGIQALSYDYSATTKCLAEPQRAQYVGGIISNPKFNHSIEGWSVFGVAEIEERLSKGGNRFTVAHSRAHPLDSFSQKVQLQKGNIYSFSAWVQISEGRDIVAVVFRTPQGELILGGEVTAEHGCWSFLKGGIVTNFSSPVEILFESKNTAVEIWVGSVSLQPFSKQQWRSHQDTSIDKVRKRKVGFQLSCANQTGLEGAKVSIKQIKSGFPFGCGMNYNILKSTDYQNWFASRFTVATFTNEMKWYSTEKKQGEENYTVADAMLQFAKCNDISVRGHNIFWDDPKYQPKWVNDLSPEELQKAAAKRIKSVVSRYAGELIAWDVMNENLHFSFYEDKLGKNASAAYFLRAYELDPNTIMFMNEYNTIEDSNDTASTPVNYMNKLQEILSFPGTDGLLAGIGLQGHFSSGQPNIAYMRSTLDILSTTGLPIWLTEVDVQKDPNQAQYLEEILREGYSHPAVQGIVIFAGPTMAGFKVMPLADENFNNTAAGDVVDKLIDEWKHGEILEITADSRGLAEVSLFHGDYIVNVNHPGTKSSTTLNIKVTKDVPQENIHIQIQA